MDSSFALPCRLGSRPESSRAVVILTVSRTLIKKETVAGSVFVGINRNLPVINKSHRHAPFTMDTIPSSDFTKMKGIENGQIILSGVLFTKDLKLEESHKDVALSRSGTCRCRIMIAPEPGDR